jgi:histidyl-tRNA synthetase
MGGRNVPACGFALYVDPLMNLLPLRSAEGDEPKVLIKAEDVAPEAIELCFSLAKSLRDAGYTTLFDFASQGKFDYRWSIVVPKKKSSPFTITNRKQGKQRRVVSIPELLDVIERQS